MTVYILIVLAVFALIFMISTATVRIVIKIDVKNGRSRSFMVVRALGGLVRLRFALAMKSDAEHPFTFNLRKSGLPEETAISPQEVFRFIRESLKTLPPNTKYFKYIKDKVRVEDFSFTAKIGTGDAAHTALLCGSLLSLLHIVLFHLRNRHYLKKKSVAVVPVFDKHDFELQLNCIIALKLRYIIIAGIQKTAEKIKDGEKIVRASN